MQQLSPSQASPEVVLNENFDTLAWAATYGIRQAASSGLTWAYYGGRWGGNLIADGTLTLTDASTTYVVVARSSGAISASTSASNWNATDVYARAYKLTTSGGVVTATEDHRSGPYGVHGSSAASELITVTGFASNDYAYDVQPADSKKYLRYTGTGAKSATFDSGDGFLAGQVFHIANRGASGELNLIGSGVTLNPPKGGALTLEPGDTVSVLFVSTTVADVFGSTEAEVSS